MAGTLLSTITNNLRMRWHETYVSEGLNQKALAFPFGVHRGFGVVPSVTGMNVTLKADATKGDHLAVHETLSTPKYSLSIHMTGDFDLSLSGFPNQTVVIGMEATYATGVDSTATINAYTLSQFAAATPGQVLGLATVVVPAAGVIPPGNITYTNRASAWANRAIEAVPWDPVLRNGSFERAPVGNVIGAQVPYWDFTVSSANANWVIGTNPSAGAGTKNIELTPTAGPATVTAEIHQNMNLPFQAGQHLRVRMAVRALQVPSAGSVRVFANWGDSTGAALSTTTVDIVSTASTIDAVYRVFDAAMTAPANTVTLLRLGIQASGATFATASVAVRFDNVQMFAELLDGMVPYRFDDRAGNMNGTRLLLQDPAQASNTDLAADIQFSSTSPASEGEVVIGRRDGAGGIGPRLRLAGRLRAGESALTSGLSILPRIDTPHSNSLWTLISQSLGEDGLTNNYRVYSDSLGGIYHVTNAGLNASNLWVKDVAGAATMIAMVGTKIKAYRQPAGVLDPASTWAIGAWPETSVTFDGARLNGNLTTITEDWYVPFTSNVAWTSSNVSASAPSVTDPNATYPAPRLSIATSASNPSATSAISARKLLYLPNVNLSAVAVFDLGITNPGTPASEFLIGWGDSDPVTGVANDYCYVKFMNGNISLDTAHGGTVTTTPVTTFVGGTDPSQFRIELELHGASSAYGAKARVSINGAAFVESTTNLPAPAGGLFFAYAAINNAAAVASMEAGRLILSWNKGAAPLSL